MFTGLIQRTGTVKRVSRGAGLVLEIAADEPWARPLEEGESVAVNGVCLTVAKSGGSRFTADVLRETESRTGLGELVPGEKVNLEDPSHILCITRETSIPLSYQRGSKSYVYVVTALDRIQNESKGVKKKIKL